MTYQAPEQKHWTGRQDSLPAERFFQIVDCINLQAEDPSQKAKYTFALLGFCCDAGVKRNLGRVGAKEGPYALRSSLAGLAVHTWQDRYLYDVGNVICHNDDLEKSQSELANIITQLLQKKIHPIVMGGGHEIAWGHFQGISAHFPNKNIGIINFDAHYDLRPLQENNKGSSGTPFLQIANALQAKNKPFNYLCIGIQELANTESLLARAAELQVETIFAAEIYQNSQASLLTRLESFIKKSDYLYVTLCLDVLANTFAPGVSAPQPLGLTPWQIIPLLQTIIRSQKVLSFDIAELAPCYDPDGRTSRLAAALLAKYISSYFPLTV